jgi:uncharacterized protein with FMN-binding domain
MRRITVWLMSTIAALVLLFNYRTSTAAPAPHEAAEAAQARPAPVPTGGGRPTGSPEEREDDDDDGDSGREESGGGGESGREESGREESGREESASGTFEGALARTEQGPVQVRITVAGGRITDIGVLAAPSGSGRHDEINSRALPILKDEALQKQSADIDTVSGATATSNGYRDSLQAAIDAANL